jgi:hypothetical protein
MRKAVKLFLASERQRHLQLNANKIDTLQENSSSKDTALASRIQQDGGPNSDERPDTITLTASAAYRTFHGRRIRKLSGGFMRAISGLTVFAIVALITGSCTLPDSPVPNKTSDAQPSFLKSTNVGFATEYSGVPSKGEFVVCTAKASPATIHFLYRIDVVTALPSDTYAEWVTVDAGTCIVVFETKRRGGPIPEVTVTPMTVGPVISAADLFYYRSINAGLSPSIGYPLAEYFDFTESSGWSGATLKGFEGAVLKVYYIPAIPCPARICSGGGHGGGGTLQFDAT